MLHQRPYSLASRIPCISSRQGARRFDELLTDGRYRFSLIPGSEMIRLSGKAVPAQKSGREKIHTIFAEQPYLANVYPGETRNIGIIFELRDFSTE